MAFTTKLLTTTIGNIESDVSTYLGAQTISTMHTIQAFQYGQFIFVLIVFE